MKVKIRLQKENVKRRLRRRQVNADGDESWTSGFIETF